MMILYFEKFQIYFENPKLANTVRSRTQQSIGLRGVLPGAILSLQASPCLE